MPARISSSGMPASSNIWASAELSICRRAAAARLPRCPCMPLPSAIRWVETLCRSLVPPLSSARLCSLSSGPRPPRWRKASVSANASDVVFPVSRSAMASACTALATARRKPSPRPPNGPRSVPALSRIRFFDAPRSGSFEGFDADSVPSAAVAAEMVALSVLASMLSGPSPARDDLASISATATCLGRTPEGRGSLCVHTRAMSPHARTGHSPVDERVEAASSSPVRRSLQSTQHASSSPRSAASLRRSASRRAERARLDGVISLGVRFSLGLPSAPSPANAACAATIRCIIRARPARAALRRSSRSAVARPGVAD
eukprot:scaffold57779_cov30-Tisochrysis_lutea.AAC.5